MADNRTMAQLLEEPTEGYEDADSYSEITCENNFEIHACASTTFWKTLSWYHCYNPKEDKKVSLHVVVLPSKDESRLDHDVEGNSKDTMPPANNGSTKEVHLCCSNSVSYSKSCAIVNHVVTPVPKAQFHFPSRKK
ncbi:hypothetical protein Tco_0598417 [Tanacetum coccineum]